jgi:hypothetical protein
MVISQFLWSSQNLNCPKKHKQWDRLITCDPWFLLLFLTIYSSPAPTISTLKLQGKINGSMGKKNIHIKILTWGGKFHCTIFEIMTSAKGVY